MTRRTAKKVETPKATPAPSASQYGSHNTLHVGSIAIQTTANARVCEAVFALANAAQANAVALQEAARALRENATPPVNGPILSVHNGAPLP